MFIVNTQKSRRSIAGFTLVEMAIVMVIVGLFLAAVSKIYVEIERERRVDDTQNNITRVVDALASFRNNFGRYPCPSSLNANPNSNVNNNENRQAYGVETDCSIVAGLAVGAGVNATNGTTVVAGDPIVSGVAAVLAPDGATRVRIGAVPFRTLNIGERTALDGYRNRLMYAVTEPLAVSATFSATGGAIRIQDEVGTSKTTPADSAHFVIFSAGPNGEGAYNHAGGQNPIVLVGPNAGNDAANYDFADAIFVDTAHGTSITGAGKFDDEVKYATHADIPYWELDPTTGQHMTIKPSGNVAVGAAAAADPSEELKVAGIIRIKDDANTTTQEGQVKTDNLCDYSSGTTDCFSSSLIGGKIIIDPLTGANIGGGMACPSGQYMIGIKNGAPQCTDEIVIRCPAGEVVRGVNSDGTLDCGVDDSICETTQKSICGTTATLFRANDGDTQTITGGDHKNIRYRCDDGTWVKNGEWGSCTCTAGTITQTNLNCNKWVGNCGDILDGQYSRDQTVSCPGGNVSYSNYDQSNCTCNPSCKTRTRNCPSGFNSGNIKQTFCPDCSTQTCQAPTTVDTCECKAERRTRKRNCPSPSTGKFQEENLFECNGGAKAAGSWTGWREVAGSKAANCNCTSGTFVTKSPCKTGFTGEVVETRTVTCSPLGETVTLDDSACVPIPPPTCSWNWLASTGTTSKSSAGIKPGDDCTCGEPTSSCKQFLSGGEYQNGRCSCN